MRGTSPRTTTEDGLEAVPRSACDRTVTGAARAAARVLLPYARPPFYKGLAGTAQAVLGTWAYGLEVDAASFSVGSNGRGVSQLMDGISGDHLRRGSRAVVRPERSWCGRSLRRAFSHGGLSLLLLLAIVTSAVAAPATSTSPAAGAPAPAANQITPAQAQQALEVLQDEKKRAQLIETLRTIAKAQSQPPAAAQAAPAKEPAPKLPLPLAPHSLGAQLLVQASSWIGDVSHELAETARAVTNFPLIWDWLVHLTTDPAARGRLFDTLWRLALVLGCALAVEWGVKRLIHRPYGMLGRRLPKDADGPPAEGADHNDGAIAAAAPAPPAQHRHRHLRRAWRLLRVLPLAVARLVLDLLPLVAFAGVGNLLLGTAIGAPEMTRLVVLAIVNAYVICRGIMCVTRMLVSPAEAQLRLLHFSDETAAYIEVWMRRIVVVAVFGGALAEVALLLGLYWAAHDALIKLVALVVHLFLVVIVLQCRRAIAHSIRAPEGARGLVAVLRNRTADLWHVVAIFFIVALWVVWAINIQNGFVVLMHYFAITVAVLIVARLAAVMALGLLDRLFRIGPELARRFPGLEARANRYYPLLRGTISAIIAAIAAIALLEVWGLNAFFWFRSGSIGGRLVSAVVTIGLTVVAAIAVWEGANLAAERHLARLTREAQYVRSARLRTLLPMFRTTLLVIVLTVVALTALSEIGVNIGPLLAGAGIIGIAVGFGSQKLVQDLITGIFLLLENAMQVGDWVTVSGLSGSVEHLSIRTIRLRAGDGSVHIIPFSSVTSVTNVNRGIGNAGVSVNVSFKEDTDRVSEALAAIAREMREDPAFKDAMRSDLQLWGVDKVDGSVVTIVGQIACTDTGRWGVQREFNRRMKKRFQELGIEIANPTQTVVLRQDAAAAGEAPGSGTRPVTAAAKDMPPREPAREEEKAEEAEKRPRAAPAAR